MKLNFPGVPVYMNGRNYYIPSLSVRDFRANYESLTAKSESGADLDNVERFIPIVGLAIRRNYPDVTDDQVGSWLDLQNFPEAIKAVQAASGMTPVTETEGGIASGSVAINWPAVLGRVVTATGWTYEQLYEASMCDVLELLAYWKEEPPSHVLLALRYLGPSRNASRPLNVAQARKDLGDLAPLLGGAEQKLPDDLKKMVQAAQEMKEKFKGL